MSSVLLVEIGRVPLRAKIFMRTRIVDGATAALGTDCERVASSLVGDVDVIPIDAAAIALRLAICVGLHEQPAGLCGRSLAGDLLQCGDDLGECRLGDRHAARFTGLAAAGDRAQQDTGFAILFAGRRDVVDLEAMRLHIAIATEAIAVTRPRKLDDSDHCVAPSEGRGGRVPLFLAAFEPGSRDDRDVWLNTRSGNDVSRWWLGDRLTRLLAAARR